MRLVLLCLFALAPAVLADEKPRTPPEPVELVGKARDFKARRDWHTYYWGDDFHFFLDAEDGKTWKIISREPTPAYHWRMGPTYPGLKVDWSKNPRVKLLGLTGVDRLPAKFYDLPLNDKHLATVLVLWVETAPDKWEEYYVNNWFHKWGERADQAVHKLYAGKKAPYDVYGFINGQAAPFSKEAQALIAKYPKAKMFHGLIRATKDNPFGYEIELLQLVGPDAGGNGVVYHGKPGAIPVLDSKK
jgi:hypothetical protein